MSNGSAAKYGPESVNVHFKFKFKSVATAVAALRALHHTMFINM